ncbi:hypothetical protein H1C71_028417 [Ictidomys tridecemlineatus]|nr:hypothetical protein H1C71_028417 [Ictidomys tridecemlineatus]
MNTSNYRDNTFYITNCPALWTGTKKQLCNLIRKNDQRRNSHIYPHRMLSLVLCKAFNMTFNYLAKGVQKSKIGSSMCLLFQGKLLPKPLGVIPDLIMNRIILWDVT